MSGPTQCRQQEGRPCYAAALSDPPAPAAGLSFQDLWSLHDRLDRGIIPIAFRDLHLLARSHKTRFCKRCGSAMQPKPGPPARECPQCGYLSFPRISPAVIVLVERDNQCLLASSPRFKGDFYSVLAGFAEPGETLEETVAREVREETGIEVTDIRYFGSQPWPFPDSLMIGKPPATPAARSAWTGRRSWTPAGSPPTNCPTSPAGSASPGSSSTGL